jgi:hypothetical protein
MVRWMRATGTALSALLLLVGACTRSRDPCPRGRVGEDDRCVSEDGMVQGDADADEVIPVDAGRPHRSDGAVNLPDAEGLQPSDGEMPEASREPDSGADASSRYDSAIIPVDATSLPHDGSASDARADGSHDANQESDSAEAAVDASNDAEAPVADADAGPAPDECSGPDLAAWRAFQASGALSTTLVTCFARDPACALGACDVMGCLRASAGVDHCVACVADETRCTLTQCPECNSSSPTESCRACACREGCIGGGSACGMGPRDICADCSEAACGNFSALDPALIMVVVEGAL